MKRIIVMMMVSVLFLSQCKKTDDEFNEEVDNCKTVPVSFEVPVDKYRSDFLNLFPDGNVKWGNKNNVEYIYLAVPDVYTYSDASVGYKSRTLGELYELKAEFDASSDKLMFKADIPQNLLWKGRTLHVYYFGNNRGDEENSNVTKLYDEKKPEFFVGMTVRFDKQTGDINDLGDYHVAKFVVSVYTTTDDDNNVIAVQLKSSNPHFKTINSVAMLDLEGETELKGPKIKSYTLKWGIREFIETYDYSDEAIVDVSNNVGKKSFIALLPDSDQVTLECNKGRYVFENGIEKNQVYVGRNGSSLDEVQPLQWETP